MSDGGQENFRRRHSVRSGKRAGMRCYASACTAATVAFVAVVCLATAPLRLVMGYQGVCNGQSSPVNPWAGNACLSMKYDADDPKVTKMKLRQSSLGLRIVEGRRDSFQIRFTAYPATVSNSRDKPAAIKLDEPPKPGEGTLDPTNWPVCADAGGRCECPNGRVAIVERLKLPDGGTSGSESSSSSMGNFGYFRIQATKGSRDCSGVSPLFTDNTQITGRRRFRDVVDVSVLTSKRYFCTCGATVSSQQLWSYLTENCQPLGVPWRSGSYANMWDSCMGYSFDYDKPHSITQSNDRYIFNRWVSNKNPVQWPFMWLRLSNGGSGRGSGQSHTPVIQLPQNEDGNFIVRAMDTYGDSWGDDASFSMFLSLDNQSASAAVPVTHSWVRQDPYKRSSFGLGGNNADSPGSRMCYQSYRAGQLTVEDHSACRSLCREAGKRCTHYGWSLLGPTTPTSQMLFDGFGPSIRAGGICQIFEVDVSVLDIAGKLVRDLTGYSQADKNEYDVRSLGWSGVKDRCESVGMRLCQVAEICRDGGNTPVPERRFEDSWVATSKSNEWTRVGSGLADVSLCDSSSFPPSGPAAGSKKELLCCVDTEDEALMPDCPTQEWDRNINSWYWSTEQGKVAKETATHGAGSSNPDFADAATAIFKHNVAPVVYERQIETFGEEFEVTMEIKNCPKGYYCPNVLPVPVGTEPSLGPSDNRLSTRNYYDPGGPEFGVLQIPCGNFPYNGNGDGTANGWFDFKLHESDFGSTYNYYCPGGTPHPVKITQFDKCAAGFIRGDKFLASEEQDCPKLVLLDDGGNAVVDYDAGVVTKPGVAEFKLTAKNSGDGVLNIKLRKAPDSQWLILDGRQSFENMLLSNGAASAETKASVPIRFKIESGRIKTTQTPVSSVVEFFWSIGARSGIVKLNVTVTASENSNMLVFPFSIQEEVVAGEEKEVSLYAFNIAQNQFNPLIEGKRSNLASFLNLTGAASDLPCFEGSGSNCLNNLASPYRIKNKEYQQLTVVLDGRRKSRQAPYTTSIKIKAEGKDGNGAPLEDSVTVPISMTVRPGSVHAASSVHTFEVPSSPYYGSNLCYIDCESTTGKPAGAERSYGYNWAKTLNQATYRSCYSGRRLASDSEELKGTCGDCYQNSKASRCGDAALLHTMTTVRQSPIELYVHTRDEFGTPAELDAVDTIEVTLRNRVGTLPNVTLSFTAERDDGASEQGIYKVSVAPPNAGTFDMEVLVSQFNPLVPSVRKDTHIQGSPFVVEATDPTCTANAKAMQSGSTCTCEAGYAGSVDSSGKLISCSACEPGTAKSGLGNGGCASCETGKVSARGAASCDFCPAGREPQGGVAAPSSTSCALCASGKYRGETSYAEDPGGDSDDASFCNTCPAGYVTREEGMKSCYVCPVGTQHDETRSDLCTACPMGKFRSDISTGGPCLECPVGKVTRRPGSENCTLCDAGKVSGESPGSTKCQSCRTSPDTKYAAPGSAKCTGCVSPLEIRKGSEARSVDDCVCPEGSYLSSGTVSTSPVCSSCPVGGFCAQGTSNISEIQAQVGYWRPDKQTANFWECPVSIYTADGRNWRNWATCYGGVESSCAPVFDWREGSIVSGGETKPVRLAMDDANTVMPRSVARPALFTTYMNSSESSSSGVTLSHAIMTYIAALRDDPEAYDLGFSSYMGRGDGSDPNASRTTSIWIGGRQYKAGRDLDAFVKKDLIKGYMSGPLCAICPKGTGRNGDFKSDQVCEPCPADSSANLGILFGLFLAALAMVVFFVYGQIKKGAHEVHLENEHTREMTKDKMKEPEFLPGGGSDDDGGGQSDASASDVLDDSKDDTSGSDAGTDSNSDGDENKAAGDAAEGSSGNSDPAESSSDEEQDDDEASHTVAMADGDTITVELEEEGTPLNDAPRGVAKSAVRSTRRNRRGSGYVYAKPETVFTKRTESFETTIKEHRELQRKHGTLSGNMMSHKQILTGMSRIMMSYLQVVAIARSVPIAWPQVVLDTLDVFAIVSAPSLSLVSVDCALSGSDVQSVARDVQGLSSSSELKPVYAKFIMTMLIPAAAFVLPGIFWGVYYLLGLCCIKKRGCRSCCDWSSELPTESERHRHREYEGVATVDERNLVDHRKRTRMRFKVTLMVIFFLFYPTTVQGVFSMFSCQLFGSTSYLISDMSVECADPGHATFVVLAVVFVVLYVIGIPIVGCYILHKFMPGIHYDPTMPISEFNPVAGRKFSREDRGLLLAEKLEATAVYGFMWEGLQQKGIAPYWEWSVIMMRKVSIICIIQLLGNMNPEYQLTIALIIMFGFNLLHVKYHPYDLFYHDRLEFLSLISAEMTLFGGLIITFLGKDKAHCESDCSSLSNQSDSTAGGIGVVIIFFNCLYLVYFALGLLYHMYFVLVPKKCRCRKAEEAVAKAHSNIPSKVTEVLYPSHSHYLMDHHGTDGHEAQTIFAFKRTDARKEATKAEMRLKDNEEETAKQLEVEKEERKRKLEARRAAAKKRREAARKEGKEGKEGGKEIEIEMV